MATPPAVANKTLFRPSTLAALHEGLWMVVNAHGTGGRARIPGRDVAGPAPAPVLRSMALGSSVTRPKIERIPHSRLLGSRDEELAAGRDVLFGAHFRFANSLYDGGVDRYWT
jgi:hypothetical protein